MPAEELLVVSPRVTIPREELLLRATRSSGPGGQHVNTSSTRVELVWDIALSPSLDENDRAWLLQRLASRLDSAGKLRLVAQDERSQLRNREAVVERLVEVVRTALIRPKTRRPTKPSRAAKRARLDTKRKQGAKKRDRRTPSEE
jgi:ribosome-associated protein